MNLSSVIISIIFLLNCGLSSGETPEHNACLTAVECLQQSQGLAAIGITKFAMGNYDASYGCFAEGNSAYFGLGGTVESMSEPSLEGGRTRIWCDASSQQDDETVAPTGSPNAQVNLTITTAPSPSPTLAPITPTTNSSVNPTSSLPGTINSMSPSMAPYAPANTTATSAESSANSTSFTDDLPTSSPSRGPSLSPSPRTSDSPTKWPSYPPTMKPSTSPTSESPKTPTFQPSRTPTSQPSVSPTYEPIAWPTYVPTEMPSDQPTKEPSKEPTVTPTRQPSNSPTKRPTLQPSKNPTGQPTQKPTSKPTSNPTDMPTNRPTPQPIPPVSSESGTAIKKACRNQKACNRKRHELGYEKFYVGNYNVKGCFSKDNAAYFGLGGTIEQKSEPSLPGRLERVWCGEETQPDPTVASSPSFLVPPEQHCIDVEVTTDRYGGETGFSLSTNPTDGSPPTLLLDFPVETLESETTYTGQVCVPSGEYVFTVEDDFHGLCCSFGQGSYRVSIDGNEIISGGSFQTKKVSYKILAGYNPAMSDRDNEWLAAHNTRREAFHTEHNKEYRPLQWSTELAADAASWVDTMLPNCQIQRETNLEEGENMAIRRFQGPSNNENPEQILTRWADTPLELGKEYPENIALTQVMWRATRYVGCSDKMSVLEDGSYCYASVCRYLRAGNCSMKQYDTWLEPTLKDRTGCGESCPEVGCY